jgi:glycosyltransferase involved in cell wall biosynthesis
VPEVGGIGPVPDPRHALVVTIVHTPLDARIHHRQIRALLDHGWRVTQAAPWSAYEVAPPPGITAIDLPRAVGRDRLGALRAARRVIRRHGPDVDVLLLHDPELLLAAGFVSGRPPTVWDVHEDTAAALTDKPWLPDWARPPARAAVRAAERLAERRLHLILAEEDYRERFRYDHPVVANHPVVPDRAPPPDEPRVVYLGRISEGRGLGAMLDAAEELAGEVDVELIGQADPEVRPRLERADRDGVVRWDGFLPNDEALARVDGALAGLSLLRDEPNYRHSLPTKVVEYLARGVPAITTPLPRAVAIVENSAGVVVPFEDPQAVAEAVRRLRDDDEERHAMAERGRELIRAEHSWNADAPRFVAQLDAWAGAR